MREKLQDFGKHLMAAGVLEILKIVGGLIFSAGLSVLVSRALAITSPFVAQHKLLTGIMFCSLGMLLFLAVYERFHRLRPRFTSLRADFKVMEKSVCMAYRDRTHLAYTKKHKIRALREGLDRYPDKYFWTGDVPPEVQTKVRGHIFTPTMRKNYWQHYEVLFGRHLNKGEEIETELTWLLDDSSRKAVPFISATVEEPTNILKLTLEVPIQWGVSEVICEVASGASSKRPLESKTMAVDQQGKVEWSIARPKLLHHYEMRWPLPS